MKTRHLTLLSRVIRLTRRKLWLPAIVLVVIAIVSGKELPARTEEWISGTVVHVSDGDTADVETLDRRVLRVRFYGIDSPEKASSRWPEQPYSLEASEFMKHLILGRTVQVRLTGETTYKREVGEIYVDDQSASLAIVAAGLAWWNEKYAPEYREIEQAQALARKQHLGLWREGDAISPWEYRQNY